jgi:hypothetical protein
VVDRGVANTSNINFSAGKRVGMGAAPPVAVSRDMAFVTVVVHRHVDGASRGSMAYDLAYHFSNTGRASTIKR